MAEPPQKKQKIGDVPDDTVKNIVDFMSNKENEELIENLRLVILHDLNLGSAYTSVYFLLVEAANANSYASFSSATVTAQFCRKEDETRLHVPYASFFARGYRVLSDLLNKEDPRLPENVDQLRALSALIQFISTATRSKESILGDSKKDSEAALALRLAQHFFIPLAPQKTFVIDCHYNLTSERCCSVEHPMNGKIGDTSYGCPLGWHGRVDVLLMDDKVPLSVVGDEDRDADDVSVESGSSIEKKKADKFSSNSVSQVIAETIVFSFLQHKRNPASSNAMVPGIGICSKKLVVYLYDCVEDILLTSGPVDLISEFDKSGLNYRAVIMLWFGLNYKLFGNATPPKYKHCISKFHNVVGPEQLKKYKEECEQPFKGKPGDDDFFKLFSEGKETSSVLDKATDIYVPECKSFSLKLHQA